MFERCISREQVKSFADKLKMGLELPKSCCCFSLRLATTLIGIFFAGFGMFIFVGTMAESLYTSSRYSEVHHTAAMALELISMVIPLYGVSVAVVLSTTLVYGAIKVKSHCCLPFLIYISLLITLMVTIILLSLLSSIPWTNIFKLTAVTVFFVACAFVVFSYYQDIPKHNLSRSNWTESDGAREDYSSQFQE